MPNKKPVIHSSNTIDLTHSSEKAKEKKPGKGKGKRALTKPETIDIGDSDEERKVPVKKGKKGMTETSKRETNQQNNSCMAAEEDEKQQPPLPKWLLEAKPFNHRTGFDRFVTRKMPALLLDPRYRHLSRPARVGVLSKMLRTSTDEVKAVYQKLHKEDLLRYERELEEWNALVEKHMKNEAVGGGGGSSESSSG